MRRAIALLALLATVSCGDDIEKRYAKANAALPPPAPPPAATSSDASAKVGATYMDEWNTHPDRTVDVKYDVGSDKHTLHGTPRTDDERDYVLDGGSSPVLTVKTQPDALKILSGPGGALRWKVKLDGDKVKISDNEQNTNAWTIATTGQQSIVTTPDGRVAGTVKYESGHNVVRDGSDNVVERMPSKIFRPGYGTLLIDGILPPERFVMMVELIDAMPDRATVSDVNAVRGTDLNSWNIDNAGIVTVNYAAGGNKHILTAIPSRNGAGREYSLDAANGLVATAFKTSNGFTVRSPSGQNRWTVAINGNTTTIAGGDHDATYEIVTTDATHATVSGNSGKQLGTVTFAKGYDTTQDAEGDLVDEMPSKKFRAAYGVLLLDGVSPVERYVILAELIDKTR